MSGYEYTRPRVPVAASYNGPGPCYALPSLVGTRQHDPTSRHTKAPAYHFGVRPASYSDERTAGPGPCYLPPAKVYHNGRDRQQCCVITNGRKEPRNDVMPGPADYAPCRNDVISYHRRQPAFSMSRAYPPSRRHSSKDSTPGPNAYNPDAMMGSTVRSSKPRAPRCMISSRQSFGGYITDNSAAPTPGPGQYKMPDVNIYLRKSPGFTIVSRHDDFKDNQTTPGPGAHSTSTFFSSTWTGSCGLDQ